MAAVDRSTRLCRPRSCAPTSASPCRHIDQSSDSAASSLTLTMRSGTSCVVSILIGVRRSFSLKWLDCRTRKLLSCSTVLWEPFDRGSPGHAPTWSPRCELRRLPNSYGWHRLPA